jgi:hypothetical protein
MDPLPVCNIPVPVCNIPMSITAYQSSFRRRSEKDYEKLCSLISEYMSADCWAFVVNDEIIFNSYNENRSFSQKLTEKGFSNQITHDPHSTILVEINRKDEDATIELYMSGSLPYKVIIKYMAEDQTYYTYIYASAEYNETYGDK